MSVSASCRLGTLTTFLHHVFTARPLAADLVDILPTKARERVRPTWLPEGEAELIERLQARRAIRAGYREAQR